MIMPDLRALSKLFVRPSGWDTAVLQVSLSWRAGQAPSLQALMSLSLVLGRHRDMYR